MRWLYKENKNKLHKFDIIDGSVKFKFCNTKLVEEEGYGQDYRCPKCGSTSGLVNLIGLCATKVYK
jgi:hypothetical protein